MIKTLTLLAAAAAAFAATPAVAGNPAEILVEKKVSYADLDLSSAAGRATLDSRIKGATRFVCGPIKGATLAEHKRRQACHSSALAGANDQVDRLLARRGSVTVLAARR